MLMSFELKLLQRGVKGVPGCRAVSIYDRLWTPTAITRRVDTLPACRRGSVLSAATAAVVVAAATRSAHPPFVFYP